MRRALPLLAAWLLLAAGGLGGCLAGAGEAQVVSPFSGESSGPRSFQNLSRQIAEQSSSLRALFIQARGLYPHFNNSYRVRIRIEPEGDVSEVNILDREYVLTDFEKQFKTRIERFRFEPYEGPAVEIIYTFTFYPEGKTLPPLASPPAAEPPSKPQTAPAPVASEVVEPVAEEDEALEEPAMTEEPPEEAMPGESEAEPATEEPIIDEMDSDETGETLGGGQTQPSPSDEGGTVAEEPSTPIPADEAPAEESLTDEPASPVETTEPDSESFEEEDMGAQEEMAAPEESDGGVAP